MEEAAMISFHKEPRTSGRVLGIELFPDRARCMDARIDGEGLHVLEIRDIDPEDLPDRISRCGEKVRVRVAAHFGGSLHQILEVPAAKSRLLSTIVAKELEKSLGDRVCSSWIELEGEDPQETGKRVMAVGVQESTVAKAYRRFRRVRGAPHALLTYPVAIQSLLTSRGLLGEQPCAYVEVSGGETAIVVYRGPEIRLVRKLGSASYGSGEGKDKRVQSVFQTILFHKHQYSGEDVGRIVVHAGEETESLCRLIHEELGKDVSALDLSGFTPEDPGSLSPTPACVGLLLAGTRHPLRLVPGFVQSERTLKRNVCLMSSVCLLLAFTLGTSYMRLQDRIQALSDETASLRGESTLREARIGESVKGLILRAIREDQLDWASVLKEWSAAVPEGIRIREMRIDGGEDGFQAEVLGQVEIENRTQALSEFTRMIENLRTSPWFGSPVVERELMKNHIGFTIQFSLNRKGAGPS
jgi:Tfp pilus assembly protein PilN